MGIYGGGLRLKDLRFSFSFFWVAEGCLEAGYVVRRFFVGVFFSFEI